jgi:CHAD domain-containing protein
MARGRRTPDAKGTVGDQVDRALRELRRKPPLRDGAVHAARKDLKRARAALRLARDAVGEIRYGRANRRLRDAARPLSSVRDARILLDAVTELRDGATRSARATLDGIARELRRERAARRRAVLGRSGAVARAAKSLESVRRESRAWPAAGPAALERGLLRVYRKGRKALVRADEGRRDDLLHEARKQTKYLAKALEVLGPRRGSAMAKRAAIAESIADRLGHDHDLAVLCGRIAKRSDAGGLVPRIEARRRKLQRKALQRGRRLYRRKAKAFGTAIGLRRRLRGP